MTDKEARELTDRQIPGITWKQVVAYTGMVALVVLGYANMINSIDNGRAQSRKTNLMLEELKIERKEDKRIDEVRLKTIETQLHQLELRTTIMEKYLEGYKSVK